LSESVAGSIADFDFEQLEGVDAVRLRDLESPLETARAEAEQVRADARAAGHAEGYAAGLEAGRVELEAAAAALAAALEQTREARTAATEALERDAVALSLALAEKVVAGALAIEPESVVAVVRGALRRLSERERVVILVNPEDLDLVRSATDGLRAELGGIEHAEVQADRRCERGGAMVRTAEGQIDARVETQLERAREVAETELSA
jgi:flagellar assembly protein FliH